MFVTVGRRLLVRPSHWTTTRWILNLCLSSVLCCLNAIRTRFKSIIFLFRPFNDRERAFQFEKNNNKINGFIRPEQKKNRTLSATRFYRYAPRVHIRRKRSTSKNICFGSWAAYCCVARCWRCCGMIETKYDRTIAALDFSATSGCCIDETLCVPNMRNIFCVLFAFHLCARYK